MRVERPNKIKVDPSTIPYKVLESYSNTESYNSLVRKLNVNVTKIKNYVAATYPNLHGKYVENALNRKTNTGSIVRNT